MRRLSFGLRHFLRLVVAGVLFLAGVPLFSAETTPWAFEEHPYRAVVKLQDAPQVPETGIRIELPSFTHMPTKTPTVILADKTGQIMPATVLWSEDGAGLLVLAQTMVKGDDYFVYFGGASVRASPPWPARPSLLLETRRLPANPKLETSQGIEDTWRRATQIDGAGFVGSIFQGENPYGESTNFISKYTGFIRIPTTQQLHLYTVSSDASFVYVNGKYEFGLPGLHHSHAKRANGVNKKIGVLPGLTKIEYYHAKAGPGAPAMGLLWEHDKKFEAIPANVWVHPGTAQMTRLEEKQGRPVPSPRIKLNSYIGFNNYWLFETTCSVDESKLEGWTVTWQFSDGAVLTGPSCSRVIPGLLPIVVTVTLQKDNDRLTGFNEITFHSNQIRQASVKKEGDLGRYIGLLSRENVARLAARTLEVDIEFLKEFAEDEQVVAFAEAFVQQKIPSNENFWLQCQLIRLHAIAQTDPTRALTELRKIDPTLRKKFATSFDPLEADLLVFYLRDPRGPEIVKQMATQHKDANIVRLLQTRVGDGYRILGRYKEAIAQYQSVQKTVADQSNGRKLPTQDRAYSMDIDQLIKDGFRKEAGQKLAEWEEKHPMAKLDSDFLLLRGRQLMEFGRWKEAIMEIESFEKMEPDSPYQVESDYYRALALHKLGQKEEARKIWNDIAKNYPKHEFAAKSKDWARKN